MPVQQQDARLWIDGVDTFRVIDPLFESVRIALAARGETYSPAYIQGISGSAFRIGGICPCAPTCAGWMSPGQLITLLGYSFEPIPLAGDGIDSPGAVHGLIDRIRREIDAGRPVIVFHAFTTAEFDVVCGYDDASGTLLGRGTYRGTDDALAEADQRRMGACWDFCPPHGGIVIGEKVAPFDPDSAEVAALREAIRHARWQPTARPDGEWQMYYGLACYQRWAEDFRTDPKHAPSGSQYCYGVVRSTHRCADEFLREIASRHPQSGSDLLEAASHFAGEADILDAAEDLLWWEAPEVLEGTHAQRAGSVIEAAARAYTDGIACIERALLRPSDGLTGATET